MLEATIVSVLKDPESKLNQFVAKAFSGPEAILDDDFEAFIRAAYKESSALLEATQ